MTFLIAAAGTGGHVYPGLAVGEALLELGVDKGDVIYVGGIRLEREVYPGEGFSFVEVELAGLKRSLSPANLKIPAIVARARRRMSELIDSAKVGAVLAMGGYVTIPAALAARRRHVPFFNAEQNADAGLANRLTARWARTSFVSFPETGGLRGGVWVGNPVRRMFWDFDRRALRETAADHFGLDPNLRTLGVFGGSLGSKIINDTVSDMISHWTGSSLQVVHLTGIQHLDAILSIDPGQGVIWVRRGFERRMDLFYAMSDLVIARAGGAVAEITATGAPALLIPGRFGSAGHQEKNARFLEERGAAMVIDQSRISRLAIEVSEMIDDNGLLGAMSAAANAIAKPDAALTIARAMIEAAK